MISGLANKSFSQEQHPSPFPAMKTTATATTPKLATALIGTLLLATALIADDLPDDARRLADARAKEIERIDDKFVAELKAVKIAHMKRGNLQAANAVANLIWSVQAKHVTQLSGRWKRDRDGGIFEFDGKGRGVFNAKDKFTVQFDAENQRFELKKADWDANYISLTDDPDVLLGSIPGVYDYKLTKEK